MQDKARLTQVLHVNQRCDLQGGTTGEGPDNLGKWKLAMLAAQGMEGCT